MMVVLKLCRNTLLACVAAVPILALSAIAGVAGELAPHRALYELSLTSAQPQSDFIDIEGGMSVDWTLTCDGWAVEQLYVSNASLRTGMTFASEIRYSSFESADGRTFRFTSVTRRNGEVAERATGGVLREDDRARATANYMQPPDLELELPAGTMFPMQHLEAILAVAEAGEQQLVAPYYDGPRPEDTPFEASALILGERRSPQEGAGADRGPPMDRPWWQVRIAFFPRAGSTPDPDFELSVDLQDNGIARALVFDYGEIIVSGDLVAVEAYERPDCP